MRPLPFPHNEYQQTAEATIRGKYSDEVKVNFIWTKTCHMHIIIYVQSQHKKTTKLGFATLATSRFLSLPSCFHPISMTLLERCTGPTPEHLSNSTKVSQVSNTTGTPLPFYFTISRPGATDPRAKHQALAPSVPMVFNCKPIVVTVLLTFNASARACGQKRCQTKLNRVKSDNLQGDLRH